MIATATGRYVVTADALDLGLGAGNFCVAVDLGDPQGVWWWERGASGCSSRSTGPGVFHADSPAISHARGEFVVRFRIPLITGPGSRTPDHKEIQLILSDGRIRVPATGADVATVQRNDLKIPERVQ
jgi:hypothetical protein